MSCSSLLAASKFILFSDFMLISVSILENRVDPDVFGDSSSESIISSSLWSPLWTGDYLLTSN